MSLGSAILFFPATVTRHFEMREVIIPKGASIEEISKILEAKDLVGNPRLFVLAARVLGYDRGLKAGRFTIPVGSSIYDFWRDWEQHADGLGVLPSTTPICTRRR